MRKIYSTHSEFKTLIHFVFWRELKIFLKNLVFQAWFTAFDGDFCLRSNIPSKRIFWGFSVCENGREVMDTPDVGICFHAASFCLWNGVPHQFHRYLLSCFKSYPIRNDGNENCLNLFKAFNVFFLLLLLRLRWRASACSWFYLWHLLEQCWGEIWRVNRIIRVGLMLCLGRYLRKSGSWSLES